jgi:hypothetical protein
MEMETGRREWGVGNGDEKLLINIASHRAKSAFRRLLRRVPIMFTKSELQQYANHIAEKANEGMRQQAFIDYTQQQHGHPDVPIVTSYVHQVSHPTPPPPHTSDDLALTAPCTDHQIS